MRLLLAALALVLLLAFAPPASGQTTAQSPVAQGRFSQVCYYAGTRPDDPIVAPGRPGASHLHDFTGAHGITAFSDEHSLVTSDTSCVLRGDRSGYWTPALHVNGRSVAPEGSLFYYRTFYKRPGSVYPFPFGLRIVAGAEPPKAPAPRPRRRSRGRRRAPRPAPAPAPTIPSAGAPGAPSYWRCAHNAPLPDPSVPYCPSGDTLEGIVEFPDCWDGRRLDSPDHRAHMAYAVPVPGTYDERSCPATHPVPVPHITMFVVYRTPGAPDAQLSSGRGSTLHGDFLNAWRPERLAELVRDCLHGQQDCTQRRIDGFYAYRDQLSYSLGGDR